MRRLIIFLSLITLPLFSFGQTSAKDFNSAMEWINHNPSEADNTEFISKSANLITFQLFSHPEFQINISGTKELDKELKEHIYRKYFIMVYSYNQLYYKLENEKFDNLKACVFSLSKLIESYSIIIKNNPELKVEILDEYKGMNEKELTKRIRKFL